jgi:hypothetical protein
VAGFYRQLRKVAQLTKPDTHLFEYVAFHGAHHAFDQLISARTVYACAVTVRYARQLYEEHLEASRQVPLPKHQLVQRGWGSFSNVSNASSSTSGSTVASDGAEDETMECEGCMRCEKLGCHADEKGCDMLRATCDVLRATCDTKLGCHGDDKPCDMLHATCDTKSAQAAKRIVGKALNPRVVPERMAANQGGAVEEDESDVVDMFTGFEDIVAGVSVAIVGVVFAARLRAMVA